MQRTVFGLLALLLLAAPSAPLKPHGFVRDDVADERRASTLRESHGALALSDGSEWALHPCGARQEPSCVAVTRFAGGKQKAFIAADFLPNMPGGTIPIGKGGQIYSVAGLEDGQTAFSVGWNDGRDSHNAVVVVTFTNDHPVINRIVELPGVRAIVGATQGRILAVTTNALIPGGGPRLTLLDKQGKILHQWLDGGEQSVAGAVRVANDIRLQQVVPDRYAVFDPSDMTIRILDLSSMTFRATTVLNDDLAGQSVRDAYTSPNNVTAVVTVGPIAGRHRTAINLYGPDGAVVGRWFSEDPWQTVLHHGHVFTGVVVKDSVTTETVDLPGIE